MAGDHDCNQQITGLALIDTWRTLTGKPNHRAGVYTRRNGKRESFSGQ